MITLQHTPILAVLAGTLALCLHPPVLAQSAGSDGTLAQIEAMVPARASAADAATAEAFDTAASTSSR